ncbi:BTAD domain-containing putative transcriptional regulator [Streptomyces sp. CC224B]|uniref:AfsR/SARP family transcriptional regulator n=1 Tax=Streptomyces sp. CC224B TaxID=3044571 RepID=UPI0024A7CCED|nr:BTAD domain-containing putative transcriptional regulator [Streptomyces sp. CC224B]
MASITRAAAGDERPALRLRLLGGFLLTRDAPGGRPAQGADAAYTEDAQGAEDTEGTDCCCERGGEPLEVPASGQQVLARLALYGAASRSELAGTLWPDATETRARARLRTAMWRLNGAGSALSDAGGGTLALSCRVRVDLQAFTVAARRVLTRAPVRLRPAYHLLLCGGELLPGWQQEWVAFERERLHQLRLHALEALSARLVAMRAYGAALEAALECTRIDPLRESAHRAVVSVHLAEHNLTEAVRQFERFRGLLRGELGVEPSGQFSAMLRHATV